MRMTKALTKIYSAIKMGHNWDFLRSEFMEFKKNDFEYHERNVMSTISLNFIQKNAVDVKSEHIFLQKKVSFYDNMELEWNASE